MLRGIVLALTFCVGTTAQAQDIRLTPEDARLVAIEAINRGDFETAGGISDALLTRNENDVTALVVRARVALAIGDNDGARKLASRAFALSEDSRAQFVSARLVALSHAQQEQFTRAQFWLRRARQVAPDAEARAVAAQDFQLVRAQNPFSVSLSFGITPSNNVNNGSSNTFVEAPDWADFLRRFLGTSAVTNDFVGLAPTSQALAGYHIRGSAQLGYDIRRTLHSRTTVTFGANFDQVLFTPQVSADNPTLDPDDFSYQVMTFGLDHAWAAKSGGFYSASPEISQLWYGGEVYQRSFRLSGKRFWPLSPGNALTFSPHYQLTHFPQSDDRSHDLGGSLQWQHVLPNRGQLATVVNGSKVTSGEPQKASVGGGVSVSYTHPEPVFGFQLSGSVGQNWRQYDGWNGGPGTRFDSTFQLGLNVGLNQVEFYGFQPVVNLSASTTASDRDLYDKSVFGIGVNFRSAF